MNNEQNILILLVFLWCFGIFVPVIIPETIAGHTAAQLYGVICHQFDSHSFHVNGEPLAVCERCTSIYFGFLLMLIRLLPRVQQKDFAAVPLLLIISLPMFVDGMLSLTHMYEATTLSRVITGSLFGAGLALLLHKTLSETIHSILSLPLSYESKTR